MSAKGARGQASIGALAFGEGLVKQTNTEHTQSCAAVIEAP